MKTFAICAALSCTAFCLVGAGSRLSDEGLTVHEWGTFTSVAGPEGMPVEWNTLGCNSDLPKFVHDGGQRNRKFSLFATVRMETPVLYFYSSHDVDASVKVSFPNGEITEWFPQATWRDGAIAWNSIQVRPGSAPEFPVESAPSRYYAARATDATPLSLGDQHEKFLFYRGVATIPVPLSARVADDGRIIVGNTGKDSVPTVFLFENRGGEIGYRNAGKVDTGATLERPVLDEGSSSQLKADLEGALMDQGLYPKEAAAMVDTWRDSWFEEGSRLIYILPEGAVNAMLPIEINPSPARISRVFVGRIELITPQTKQAVQAALSTGDTHTLELYQRFLQPIGNSIGKAINLPCQAK
ncbi:MAG TPA: hypothetical protein VK789_13835 [Bryobacteraceae bacterium]|nr:hypothetical protein [Bryobacteraceae bacterium]